MISLQYIKCVTYRFGAFRFSTSIIHLVEDPLASRFVAKIFRKQQRKHKNDDVFTHFDMKIPGKSTILPTGKPVFAPDNPRLEQSETLLHETISSIIQNGHLGITVTVTKVKLAHDFSQMNIFWEATGDTKTDKKTQNTLNSKTKILRHFIINSEKSGYVPTISFLKDVSYAREKELEECLKNLDTGYNHKDGPSRLTELDETHTDIEASIKTIASQNVLGLPHDDLMKKVIKSKLPNKSDGKEDLSYTGKLYRQERRKDVKQYSKLLGVHSKKKNSAKLIGDLTHMVPDIIDNLEVDRQLAEIREDYIKERQRSQYFLKIMNKKDFQQDEEDINNEDDDIL